MTHPRQPRPQVTARPRRRSDSRRARRPAVPRVSPLASSSDPQIARLEARVEALEARLAEGRPAVEEVARQAVGPVLRAIDARLAAFEAEVRAITEGAAGGRYDHGRFLALAREVKALRDRPAADEALLTSTQFTRLLDARLTPVIAYLEERARG